MKCKVFEATSGPYCQYYWAEDKQQRRRDSRMSPVSRFLCLFILPAMGGASPLEEMMVRVEQYKEKALTAPGCGFWREVLRLHHKVLLKKSSPGASNKSSRHLATVTRSSWLMMVIVWMISTWQPSPGSCSRSGTTRCGARQPATVFWLDLQFSLGGSTIKVGPEPCLLLLHRKLPSPGWCGYPVLE